MSKGGGNNAAGYRYYFSILMGLCRGPIDQLVAVDVADVEAWPALGAGFQYPSLPVETMKTLTGEDAGAGGSGYIVGSPGDDSGTPLTTTARFLINRPNLFGGDKQEGGIYGSAALLMGHPTQIIPEDVRTGIATGTPGYVYLYADANGAPTSGGVGGATDNGYYDSSTNSITYDSTGDDFGTVEQPQFISGFRGITSVWYDGLVCSNNPYPKAWKFRVRRALQGWDSNGCWYPDKAIIAYSNPNYASGSEIRSMNPAHILYQVVTDKTWGRGLDRAEMDDAAWTYAANYLFNEGLGLNLRWVDGDIDAFVQKVVDHINAAIYVDRSSGLLVLKLIRDDYDPNTIPVFNYDTGLLKVDLQETGSGTVIDNEVVVKYMDPITGQEKQTRAQNLASIQSLGSVISVTKNYEGVGWASLAVRLALRDLQIGSLGLKKFKLQFDRRAWKLQPGSVAVIQAPDKGIASMIVRIATYDDGTLIDGTIKIDAMQDSFGMPSTLFSTPEVTSGWIPQIKYQVAPKIQNRVVYEATYYDMYRNLSTANLEAITDSEGGIIAVAQRPVSYALNQVLWVTPAGGTPYVDGVGSFCPAGFVALGGVGYYDTTVQLTHGTQFGDVAVGSMAILGSEIVRIDAVDLTTGIFAIARGCSDTIPQTHLPTTVMFFSDSTLAATTQPFASGEVVDVQQLSRISTGLLDPSNAPDTFVTVAGRHALPLPPANLKLNGTLALNDAGNVVVGTAVFTWNTRNHLTQQDQLIGHTEGSVAAIAGTTYTVEVWDRVDNTMIRSHSGITGTTYTYDSTEATSGPDPAALTFVIYSVLAGKASYCKYNVFVLYSTVAVPTGWDYGWSYDWSGV